jgi:hypothetical protein
VALGIAGIDIFVVGKPLPAAGNSWRTLLRGGTTDHPILVESGATRLGYFVNAIGFNPFGSLTLDGSTRALLYVSIPATRIATAALNGTVALSSGTNAMSASADLQTLGNNTGGSQPWGDINEVIFLSNTTTAERQQVEGYLAWKWGLQANLPATHPYVTIPPAMRFAYPFDIPDCALWLDATDRSMLTVSGTSVTQWRDKSGRGNNTTSIDSATYVESGLNGLPCVSNITNGTGPIQNPGSAVLSVFAVASVVSLSGTYWNLLALNNSVKATAVANFYAATNMFVSYYGGQSPPIIYGFMGGGNMSLAYAGTFNQPMLWEGFRSGATTNTFGNGTQYDSTTVATTVPTYNAYWLGGPNPSIPIWPGMIGEILVYNRTLLQAERQQIEGYLTRKWGLLSTFPATHPFKTIPPNVPLVIPTQLGACALWLDAADPTTVTGTSPVTQWRDKSGNVRHLSVGSGTTTYVSNSIRLNTSYMLVTSAVNLTNVSVFIVCMTPNGVTNQTVVVGRPNTNEDYGSTDGFGFYVDGTTQVRYYGTGVAGQTIVNATATGSAFLSSFTAASTGAMSSWQNGTVAGTAATGARTSTAQGFAIGASWNGTLYNNIVSSAYIYEVLVYTEVLSTFRREQVEGYLAWKWGIQSSLPASHLLAKTRP